MSLGFMARLSGVRAGQRLDGVVGERDKTCLLRIGGKLGRRHRWDLRQLSLRTRVSWHQHERDEGADLVAQPVGEQLPVAVRRSVEAEKEQDAPSAA